MTEIDNKFLDAALRYIGMGLKVVILGKQSKETITKWTPNGLNDATLDPEVARGWWELTPKCNVAIVCGETAEPGRYLTVLDFDVDGDNDVDSVHDFLVPWEREHGELPETVTEITGRGGMHYFYWTDEPVPKCENQKIHVDIRGVGSYTMVAPSIHPNGNAVEFENHPDDYEIAWADDNVREIIKVILDGAVKDKGEGGKVDMSGGLKVGRRNTSLYEMAAGLMAQSWDDDAIIASIETYNRMAKDPLPANEVKAILSSALKLPKGKSAAWYIAHGLDPNDESFKLTADVRKLLAIGRNGMPAPTITNCMTVLGNDPKLKGRFGYNVIAYTKTVEGPLPWNDMPGTRQVSDVDYSQFAAYLEKSYAIDAKAKAIDAIANVCSFNRYNPIAEWLETLEWDGVPRTRGLLPLFLGCAESDYNTEVIELFMRGAIARALEPGTKFDHMIVLVGKQGIGKSMFLRRLAHKNEWFNDNFNTIDGDAAVEKLRGMWMVEMAELLATKKAKEIESIKAFVTSRVDVIRPKYARETEQRPRVCVIAGTTNDFAFLSDPTGNRRFIPVHCLADEPQELLFDNSAQEFFDNCWAEVYARWKAGERSLVLPRRFEKIADTMRETHTEDDPRIALIQQHLDAKMQRANDPESAAARVCVTELLHEVFEMPDYRNPPRRLVNEMHAIMRNSVEGYMPYPKAGGKAKTAYGMQRCYVIDPNSQRYAELRQILNGTA